MAPAPDEAPAEEDFPFPTGFAPAAFAPEPPFALPLAAVLSPNASRSVTAASEGELSKSPPDADAAAVAFFLFAAPAAGEASGSSSST